MRDTIDFRGGSHILQDATLQMTQRRPAGHAVESGHPKKCAALARREVDSVLTIATRQHNRYVESGVLVEGICDSLYC